MKFWRDRWPQIAFGLILLFVVTERLRLLSMPLERDEGEFAYSGQLLLRDIPPYMLCYSMKMPGMTVANAVIMAIFGQSDVAIHLGAMIVNLVGVALLYWIARRYLEVSGAALAAGTHALLTLSPSVYGFAAHATQFVIVAALGALALLSRAMESKRRWMFFASGVLFGFAFLLKQPGAAFGFFGLVILLEAAVRERKNWREHAERIGCFALGGLAPCGITALLLWRAGVFERFWFWTVTYARLHGGEVTWAEGGARLWDYARHHADRWVWIAGAAAAVVVFATRMRGRWLALGFGALSAAAVAGGLYFTGHYFILLIPALSLVMGGGLQKIQEMGRAGNALALAVFALVCGGVLWSHQNVFFHFTPQEAAERIYFGNPFVECREIGRHLRENSAPSEKIAVIGSEPEILFYARRESATGYIYMYDLTENLPSAEPMQQEMMTQVESAKPEFLIFVRDNFSLYATKNPRLLSQTPLKNWTAKFASDSYEPAGLVAVRPNAEYYWGADAFNRPPQAEQFISILRRREGQ